MIYSWIALSLSVAATLPQLHQTVVTRSVEDYNIWSLVLACLANSFLAIDGYLRKDYGLFAIGLWFIAYNSIILFYKCLTPTTTK